MSLSVTKRVWIFSEQSHQTFDWLSSHKAAETPCRPAEEEEEDVLPPTPPPPGCSTSAALESDTEEIQVRTNVDLYIKMITKVMKINIKR